MLDDMPLGELGVIYCWHKYRKGLSYDQNRSPSTMKGKRVFNYLINYYAVLNFDKEIFIQ